MALLWVAGAFDVKTLALFAQGTVELPLGLTLGLLWSSPVLPRKNGDSTPSLRLGPVHDAPQDGRVRSGVHTILERFSSLGPNATAQLLRLAPRVRVLASPPT